jgi:hypothetical protein
MSPAVLCGFTMIRGYREMHRMKIEWFVVSMVLVALGCRGQDTATRSDDGTACPCLDGLTTEASRDEDETVCRFFNGFDVDVIWDTYHITSEEGLAEIDAWTEKYLTYLEYPSYDLAIVTHEIYSRRGNKETSYGILCAVPIDTTIPRAFQKYKPHMPKESVGELKEIALKYGVKIDDEGFWSDLRS